MKKINLLVLLGFILLGTDSYSQNFKKIFKSLKKNDIEKANIELGNMYKTDMVYTQFEITLFHLSKSIINNTRSVKDYNPYNSLERFKTLKKGNYNILEVNKFLKKYNFSIESIEKDIYSNIFQDAKSYNKESGYSLALSVCQNCFYFKEAKLLMIKSAYDEAKYYNNISYYSYFINNYSNSEYRDEIYSLLLDLEFKKSKQNLSINDLEYFIDKYKKNRYTTKAISIRDSLVFYRTPKTYDSYKKYLSHNPYTKYSNEVKEKLPDLLYSLANTSNNKDLFDVFISEYPNNPKVEVAKDKFKKIFKDELINSPSFEKLKIFKSRYPKSSFALTLENKLNSIKKNNDWVKEGLKGNVKNIKITGHNYNSNTKQYKTDHYIINIEKYFTEMGKLKLIKVLQNHSNQQKGAIANGFTNVITEFGIRKPIGDYHLQTSDEIIFIYDSNYNLLEIKENNKIAYHNKITKFKYDSENHIIESNTYFKYDEKVVVVRIIYKWTNDKIVSKKVYRSGVLHKPSSYERNITGNKTTIKYLNDYEYHNRHTTYIYNNIGNAISKTTSYFERNNIIANNIPTSMEITKYDYDNSNRLIKSTLKEWDWLNPTRLHIASGNKKAYYFDENNNAYKLRQTLTIINYNRNKYGNIINYKDKEISTTIKQGYEWEYKYDSFGNWIQRKEYRIYYGSKKESKIINREINYYK